MTALLRLAFCSHKYLLHRILVFLRRVTPLERMLFFIYAATFFFLVNIRESLIENIVNHTVRIRSGWQEWNKVSQYD